jgi:hypothetical protein
MLESLIAIIPILLLVVVPALLAIRRALRRRRSRVGSAAGVTAAHGSEPSALPRSGLQPAAAPRGRPGSASPAWVRSEAVAPSAVHPAPEAATREAEAAAASSRDSESADSRREGYVYPPPLHFRRLAVEGGMARKELRMPGAAVVTAVSMRTSWPGHAWRREWQGIGTRAGRPGLRGAPPQAKAGAALWWRLQGLSPLKKAIVLTEILGPPRAVSRGTPGWPIDPVG